MIAKEALHENANLGERRIYMYLPTPADHTNHLNGEVNVRFIFVSGIPCELRSVTLLVILNRN